MQIIEANAEIIFQYHRDSFGAAYQVLLSVMLGRHIRVRIKVMVFYATYNKGRHIRHTFYMLHYSSLSICSYLFSSHENKHCNLIIIIST